MQLTTNYAEQLALLTLDRQQEMRQVAAAAALLRATGTRKPTFAPHLAWAWLGSIVKRVLTPHTAVNEAV